MVREIEHKQRNRVNCLMACAHRPAHWTDPEVQFVLALALGRFVTISFLSPVPLLLVLFISWRCRLNSITVKRRRAKFVGRCRNVFAFFAYSIIYQHSTATTATHAMVWQKTRPRRSINAKRFSIFLRFSCTFVASHFYMLIKLKGKWIEKRTCYIIDELSLSGISSKESTDSFVHIIIENEAKNFYDSNPVAYER